MRSSTETIPFNAPQCASIPARIATSIPEIAWPAIPQPADATLLGLLFQLAQSERLSRSQLTALQLKQASRLIEHARQTVPFYRERLPMLDRRLTLAEFRRIPVLTRSDIQSAGHLLASHSLPPDHQPMMMSETSGSTGRPVRLQQTYVTRMMQTALDWRNYSWHGLDVSAKAGAIRRLGDGQEETHKPAWGTAFHSGPFVRFDIRSSADEQLAWLMREQPRYLVCYPSMFAEIARRCESHGLALPFLESLLSFGESLSEEQRALFKRTLGVATIDCYSTIECGCLALQCPQAEHKHVMAEATILEVLDEKGRPCRSGQMGRVVVTILHNFATPLIRYDLGDIAELGSACACGRGLPVLKRVLGRRRNLLVLPDGTRRWPIYSSMKILEGTPIRQFQFAQTSLDTIEARLVVERPMSQTETSQFERALLAQLRHPFRIEYRFVEEIPRGPGGKYEDFRCEVIGTDAA